MKPLGGKAYGSIGHLPGSRLGVGDHHVHDGQGKVCTDKLRDKRDRIIVQEKLDGSCVSVALKDGQILALTRAGYLATTSPYEQHWLFESWVRDNEERFRELLTEGERVCGEWLAMAHGTRYALPHEPFVAFDVMKGGERMAFDLFSRRMEGRFVTPRVLSDGPPLPLDAMLAAIATSGHGAIDPVEGAVYRVERRPKPDMPHAVDYLAKYVRHDKADGCYLPQVSGKPAIWHWRPLEAA